MSKAHVLIVEDEAIVAFDIANQLKTNGYSVAGITGYGEDVPGLLAKKPVDLILLDVRLKGKVSGIEVAKTIENTSSCRIVFLTALGDCETVSFIKNKPLYSLVKKPFDPHELFDEIEHSLARAATS